MRAVWVVGLLLVGCNEGSLDVSEDSSPGESSTPTWGDCRIAYQTDTLEGTLQSDCESLHQQAPTAREFGIRWVLLDDVVEDIEATAEERLAGLNSVYAPAGISFRNSTYLAIEEPVATCR